MVITSDGSYRGAKTIDLKVIVDEALENCPCVETVLVAKRINSEIKMKEGRDQWLQPLLDNASIDCEAEINGCGRSLYLFYILLVLQECQKEWCIQLLVIWYIQHIRLKMHFNIKKMTSTGVPLILVGLLDILILCMVRCKRSNYFNV